MTMWPRSEDPGLAGALSHQRQPPTIEAVELDPERRPDPGSAATEISVRPPESASV